MKRLFYLFFICFLFSGEQPLFSGPTENFMGAQCDVDGAGVLVIKRFPRPDGAGRNFGVILGGQRQQYSADGSLQAYGHFYGGVDSRDRYSSETAARELREESGDYFKDVIKVSSRDLIGLKKCVYVNTKSKCCVSFLLREDNASVKGIEEKCQAACNNKKLHYSRREVDKAAAVSLYDLTQLIYEVEKRKLRPAQVIQDEYTKKTLNTYPLSSRTNRIPVVITSHMVKQLPYQQLISGLKGIGIPEGEYYIPPPRR
jgi:hypothetical protein